MSDPLNDELRRLPVSGRKGRPQKFPGQGPRIAHAVRLTAGVASRIRAAAAENDRSIGEELELRIMASLAIDPPDKTQIAADSLPVIGHLSLKLTELTRTVAALVTSVETLKRDSVERPAIAGDVPKPSNGHVVERVSDGVDQSTTPPRHTA